MTNEKIIPQRSFSAILSPVALLLVLASTAAPFFLSSYAAVQKIYPYIYSAGGLLLLVCRLFDGRSSTDMRLKRLYRLDVWVAIIFCVAAFFLFYNPGQLRDWIAFTLAGAVVQIYTSLAIPARENKVARK